MLEEIKRSYEEKASYIPNYEKIPKNDLIDAYINYESDPKLKECYLSAIICRYWPSIAKNYYKKGGSNISVEDCYEWLIRGVLDCLRRRPWLDPKSKIYQLKNGQDIAMNQCILTSRMIYYQESNYNKRKINHGLASIEEILEAGLESYLPSIDDFNLDSTNKIIKNAINSNNYLFAFIVDGIAYSDVFKENPKTKQLNFDEKRLIKQLKNLDKEYAENFSLRFKADFEQTLKEVNHCKTLNSPKLYKKLKIYMKELKHNPLLDQGDN